MDKILIIEYDYNVRSNIAELLEYSGYQVLQAENAQQGIGPVAKAGDKY